MRIMLIVCCLFLIGMPTYASALGDLIFLHGFEESCEVDSDNDRLVNCQEVIQGTSITNPDTDGDGLRDGDEVLGTLGGLSLPAMGVNPLRKDLLIEHDWADDATDCVAHTHKPTIVALEQLRQIFAVAPVPNPNGQSGINVINDIGQGGQLTGANIIAIPNGTIQGDVFGADFASYKSANFSPNRLGYFHYAIHAHRYTANPGSSGYAELVGDDFIVTLQCAAFNSNVLNTTMHELGHNLGLLHGGDSSCNRKPNYNSIMNFSFQFQGQDINCDRLGDGVTNFSIGTRIVLNENSLDESAGVCGTLAIDWNNNGIIENGIQADLNFDSNNLCGGQFTVLTDFNDWANLVLASLPGAPSGGGPLGGVSCQDTPLSL